MGCRTYAQKEEERFLRLFLATLRQHISNMKFEDLIGRMCMMRILN